MRIETHIQSEPRRIGLLKVALHLRASLSAEERVRLEQAAEACWAHSSSALRQTPGSVRPA